jgi:hypothetical protein
LQKWLLRETPDKLAISLYADCSEFAGGPGPGRRVLDSIEKNSVVVWEGPIDIPER